MLKRITIADGWTPCTDFVIVVLLMIKVLSMKEMLEGGSGVTDNMLTFLILYFLQLSLPLLLLHHSVKFSLSPLMTLLSQ